MPPNLFLTGATGYIGGSVLAALVKKHPDYNITVLLRNIPSSFHIQYPNVNIIQGDFDNYEIISNAAAEADIAIHNGDGDHSGTLQAIISGLVRRNSPSYLIKLSGTGIFYEYPATKSYLGVHNPKTYSDIHDIDEITSRPLAALHRATDKLVQDAAVEYDGKLKTAIVCPPDIFGRGSGPGRKVSYYIPWFVQGIAKLNASFYLGEGGNVRGWVHIDDFVQLYVGLVEAAVVGGGSVSWGKQAYFLAATQEYTQKAIAEATAKILHQHNIIPSPEPISISEDKMRSLWLDDPDTGLFSFGCNSRTRADRAKKELEFVSKAPGLSDVLEGDLLDALEESERVSKS